MSGVMSEGRIVRTLTEVFESTSKSDEVSERPSWVPLKVYRLIEQAGCSHKTVYRTAAILGVISVLMGVIGAPVFALVLLMGGYTVMYLYCVKKRSKRFTEVDRDLPALLTFLASSVRAGLDPMVALLEAPHYLPEGTALHKAVEDCAGKIKAGETEEDCIRTLCDKVSHPDLPLLRSCLLISRRHGTSIAEPLHRVTRVVRQRQSFRRKVRGALVMHRMSAMGIALCAILISVMQFLTNYPAMMAAIRHPVGSKILMCGAFLIFIGVSWMMTMGQKEGG
jgi:Flp pilus assembly protein TadB